MKRKKFLVGMITVGAVVGWIIGYCAGRAPDFSGWWSALLLLCIIFASAFTLRLVEIRRLRRKQASNPKKKVKK